MKNYWKYGCLLYLLLCHLSCIQEEMAVVQPTLGISVSIAPMELKGALQTRALFPLGPERENFIKTLSLLAFNKEGSHVIGNYDYYAFRQIASEKDPEGMQTVFEEAYGGNLTEKGTICAIANMSQEVLLNALKEKAEEGEGSGEVISLEKFKQLIIDLPYIQHRDSVGLLSTVYMFGYYEGELNPFPEKTHNIKISLGRILTRLDVSLSVDTSILEKDYAYAVRLLNTSRTAYIFPGEQSPKETVSDSYFYPVVLSQAPSTFYYYVGPHSANNKDEATCIEIAYGKNKTENGDLDTSAEENYKTVKVELCNEPPSMGENRNYWLNRNSIYHFSINLVQKTNRRSNNAFTYEPELSSTPTSIYEMEVKLDNL